MNQPTADEIIESVIALWNHNDGWIPGADFKRLAYALRVDPSRLTHYDLKTRSHVAGV